MGIISKLEHRASSLSGMHPRDPALAEWFGMSSMSAAGVSVTPDSAMRASAVYSCVRVLSETVASTPLILYRRLPDGGRERAKDHRLYSVVGRRPNAIQTRFEWLEQSTAHINLRGAGYSRILSDRRGNVQLIPLHPSRVTPRILDSGKLAFEYTPQSGGREILLQDEVLRVPFMTLDGIVPLSVIGAQRETIGASLAIQDYGSRFFANDARPSMWIEFPGKFKDTDAQKEFRKSFQESQTGINRHKAAVMEQGMKIHELGISNEDAQFLETKNALRSEIAGMFRMQPHLIGDLSKSTNNNIEQQSLEFVMYTMSPWFVRYEQALSRDLLRDDEQDEYFFEFLVDGLLRGDSKSRSQFYKDAIFAGWMNRNEVRAKENMNMAPGLDEYIAPVNYVPSEQLGNKNPNEGNAQ
jgi:HK97 family phage portal protein